LLADLPTKASKAMISTATTAMTTQVVVVTTGSFGWVARQRIDVRADSADARNRRCPNRGVLT
jgi:hypothetical protein